MAILVPAASVDPYAAVGMEYETAGDFETDNAGPPEMFAFTAAGGSVTFDSSESVRGLRSLKCVLDGAADASPSAKLVLDLTGYDSSVYECAFWLKVGPDVPLTKGLVLLRFGDSTPSLGIRKVANNSVQLVVNNGTPTGMQSETYTYSMLPVLVPNQWHYVRVSVSGFDAASSPLTFDVWLDGLQVTWVGSAPTMTGFPPHIELGAVRSVDALGAGATATVWIDELRIVNDVDVTPDAVSCTTALPILTGSGAMINVGTNVNAAVTVDYGTASGVYTGTVMSAANTWHRLPITQASGTCYYRVTLTNAANPEDVTVLPERSFGLSHAVDEGFRIGVISDLQHFVTRAACGYYLALKAPDIVLCPGDITAIQDPGHAVWDTLAEAERHRLVAADTCVLCQPASAAAVLMALGNHDFVGSAFDHPASSDWIRGTLGLPGDSIVDYGNARIITLEDMGAWPTSSLTDARLSWLLDALRASNATWKVVSGHYPPYYWEVLSESANPQYAGRAALAAVLEAGGCNLFVGAHYHSFNVWSDNGVCYLMNSSTSDSQGGVEGGYYNAVDGDRYPKADSLRRSIYKGGYTVLDVGTNSIGITFRSRDDDSVLHYHRLRQRAGGIR